MPGARCTRSLAWEKIEPHEYRHREVHRFHPAFPHAMVLTVSSVIFPVIGFVVTVASGILPARLTPASRRQDHTTSPSASSAVRPQHISVHRIPSPTSVTIAKRPSWWDGMIPRYSCFYQGVKRSFGISELFSCSLHKAGSVPVQAAPGLEPERSIARCAGTREMADGKKTEQSRT